MLAIKCTLHIFFISAYVSPPSFQQDIWYVKVGVLKNWRQLFSSISYSIFIGAGYAIYLFLFLTYIFTRYSRNIPLRKYFDPRNTHVKTFWTQKIPTRKNFEPTMYPQERFFDPRGTAKQWHKTYEAHDGTWPTEFSTLSFVYFLFLVTDCFNL